MLISSSRRLKKYETPKNNKAVFDFLTVKYLQLINCNSARNSVLLSPWCLKRLILSKGGFCLHHGNHTRRRAIANKLFIIEFSDVSAPHKQQPTDKPTNRQTYGAAYRVACMPLKTKPCFWMVDPNTQYFHVYLWQMKCNFLTQSWC